MKKLLSFLLVLILAFSGCTASDNINSTNVTESEELTSSVVDDNAPLDNEEYTLMRGKLKVWFFDQLENGTLFSLKLGQTDFSSIFAECQKDITVNTDENGDLTVNAVYNYADMRFELSAVLCGDSPVLDYVVWIENLGETQSEVVKDFCAVNTDFELACGDDGYALNTTKGSTASHDDFKPVTRLLHRGTDWISFAPSATGRSSEGAWPYFDVLGENEGLLLAVGWSGQWKASFRSRDGASVGLKVQQQNLSTVLMSGEKIRSPRVVLVYFEGDRAYGHNVWRETVVSRYLPKASGDASHFTSPIALNFWGGRSEKYVLDALKRYSNAGINADILWLDAGWNGSSPYEGYDTYVEDWSSSLGWWSVNSELFTDGSLITVTQKAHQSGCRVMLWIMLEDARASVSDKLTFGRDAYYDYELKESDYECLLLRLDDDGVLDIVLEYLRKMIDEQGVDCVRLDSWSAPMDFWIENDRASASELKGSGNIMRNGITENKYVLNLYRLWDTLYAEYPNFFLDNTASGGRRMDIEMASRGITMWRSDSSRGTDLEETQAQLQWLSEWLPFHSVGTVSASEPYEYRSLYAGSACLYTDAVNSDAILKMKRIYDEYDALREYWYGDYYQLLEARYDKESWQAYQLFREDRQEGMAVVIRRENAVEDSVKIKLQGLDADGIYEIKSIDGNLTLRMNGSEIMEHGFEVALAVRQISTILISRK